VPRVHLALVTVAVALAAACGGSDASDRDPNSVEPFRAQHPFLTSLPEGYRIETLLDGLEQPTSIASTPDGRLLITEQIAGRVRVVQDGVLLEEPWIEIPVHYAPDQFMQELGLVSVAADPDFAENSYVYLYYTEPTENPSLRRTRTTPCWPERGMRTGGGRTSRRS
jgi:glucose/arabinose dehydrogenase